MRWIGASSLSFYDDLPRMNKAHESFLNMLKHNETELEFQKLFKKETEEKQ